MKKAFFLFSLLFTFFCGLSQPPTVPIAQTIPNTVPYTLSQNSVVSIGIYYNNSLIKTIKSNVFELAGTHQVTWDGTNDDGVVQTIGLTYQYKVSSNNVTYTWGVIGNSSIDLTGNHVHRGGSQIQDMFVSGSKVFYNTGFSEQNCSEAYFLQSDPQHKIEYSSQPRASGQNSKITCGNSNYVLWAGTDYNGTTSFIFGNIISSGADATFSNGTVLSGLYNTRTYNSVLSRGSAPITGMAMQSSASAHQYTFVARASLNQIQVLDITAGGTTAQTVTISNPGNLVMQGDGSLWISSGPAIIKYTVGATGTLTAAGPQITGFSYIVGLSYSSNELAVADAGNQQIVKFYNATTLALTHTIGILGGYSTTPVVSDNRFYFSDLRGTFINFCRHDGTGGIWIGDPGNLRVQHFDGSGTFLESITYVPTYNSYTTFQSPTAYNVNICGRQNTSIFLHLKEYTIDYSQPLSSGWTLAKNWGYNLPPGYDNTGINIGVYLYPNGHRYMLVQRQSPATTYMAELTSTGLRFTPTTIPLFAAFDKNGDLTTFTATNVHPIATGPAIFTYKKQHVTFDVANNPVIGPLTTVATLNQGYNDPLPQSRKMTVVNGRLAMFDPTIEITRDGSTNKRYSLGIYDSVTTARIAHTRIRTTVWYRGDIPTNGDYDIGNTVQHQGTTVDVALNEIICGDRGEFEKQSETGLFYHYNDIGLLQGIFGVAGPQVAGQVAPFGYASNSLSTNLTSDAGDVIEVNSDESQHAAIHVWRIGNLASKNVQVINLPLTNRVYTPFANVTDLLKNVPNGQVSVYGTPGFTQSTLDTVNKTSTSAPGQFYSRTRINIYDFTKSADVQFYSTAAGSVLRSWSIALNPVAIWTVTGYLDLTTNAFAVNTESGNPGGYIEISDPAGKAIARLYFFNSNRIQFNHVFKGPFNQPKFNSSRFSFNRVGTTNQVYFSIDLWGTPVSVQANMFDLTADITKPTYLKIVNNGITNSAFHVGLNEGKQL